MTPVGLSPKDAVSRFTLSFHLYPGNQTPAPNNWRVRCSRRCVIGSYHHDKQSQPTGTSYRTHRTPPSSELISSNVTLPALSARIARFCTCLGNALRLFTASVQLGMHKLGLQS